MPKVYCDHNFVIAGHDAPADYKALLAAAAQRGIRFVFSPWHWLEMARDPDRLRGLSVAAFVDSLRPLWLLDRVSLHAREILIALFVKTGMPPNTGPAITTLEAVVEDLNRTRMRGSPSALRRLAFSSPDFVRGLQRIGDDHPLELAIRNNYKAHQQNMHDYCSGRLASWMLSNLDTEHARVLMESIHDLKALPENIKEEFLKDFRVALCPSIAVETAITQDGWQHYREMSDHNFRDLQHAMALPYADVFVTDDRTITAIVNRVLPMFPFRTATVLTRVEFNGRYL
jgi:hypothetical protein